MRDKDAVNGAYLICEMFAYYKTQDISLIDKLNSLYEKYGYCLNTLHSYEFDGSAGFAKMQDIMAEFHKGLDTIGGKKVIECQDYSKGLNGLPKTECWYIIDCPDDAKLVVGHNAKTHEELSDMIHEGRWDEFIRYVPIKKGDFIQIDPGTVHAITSGCMILETQQNSDITYRVYDYDRLTNGKPRELHVDKSIDVITVPAKSTEDSVMDTNNLPQNKWNKLIECEYYKVYKLVLDGELEFEQSHPFLNMSVLDGEGTVNGQRIKKGDHFIIPAGYGNVKMEGTMEVVASGV